MDDGELEKVTHELHTIELNLNGIRNELKKSLPIEKMRKWDVNFKTLQQ